MPKMQKRFLEVLKRVDEMERRGLPLTHHQLVNAKYFTDRGLLRLSWGKEGTPDADRMVWYLTPRGQAALDGNSND